MQTQRNSVGTLPAVTEVVNKKDDFGIDGYFIPNFNAALDKPRVYRFSPTKNRMTFIDFAVKQKQFLPGSTKYDVARNLLDPKKGLLTSKGKRRMFSEEIEDLAKKYKKPDPGAYNAKVKERFLGALNLKDERTTFVDEAMHLGKNVIPPYDAKFGQVQERSPTARFYPPRSKDEKPGKSDNMPSPVSYNMDDSYKQSQLIKPRFFIPKGKIVSLAVQASKQKAFVPSPGQYDIEKSYSVITKGASKGWK